MCRSSARSVTWWVTVLALTACAPSGDIAAVAEQTLTQEELRGLLDRIGPAEASTYAVADALAEGWLDLALIAESAAAGLTAQDAGLRDQVAASWSRIEHLRRLQNVRAMARAPLTEDALEEAFRADSLRLYQRVLVRAGDQRDFIRLQVARARADSILALAQAGAPFDRLARELSEGPAAPGGGYLNVVRRRDVSAAFGASLWEMEPGEISPVLEIEGAFQVLRRPPLREVRQQFSLHLLRDAAVRADSLLADSLATAHRLTLLPTTAQRLRAVLTNPDSLAADSEVVVRFEGGGVTPTATWSWLAALPDAQRLALARSSQAELEEAARVLARNELLFRMAGENGLEVTAEDLAEPLTDFEAAADSLFGMFAGMDAQERSHTVDSLVGAALAGSPMRLLPAGLAPALRRRMPHAFDRGALASVARRIAVDAELPGN